MLPYVGLGGLLGTLARFGLQGWLQTAIPGDGRFPIGTLGVNVLGSLALGFLMRYTTGSALASPEVRAGLTIGFCGAFTTMSTFGYESLQLLGDGQFGRAAAYMGLTLGGTLLAVLVGAGLAERLL
jgi:CrcB protein